MSYRVINVKEHFGAKGDGITNDTVAIQQALLAGQIVYLPSDSTGRTTYLVSGNLDMTLGQTLIGDGPYTSTLRWSGQADGNALSMADFCVIEKIGLIGEDATNKHGIAINSAGRCVVRDVELQTFDNNITIDDSWLITLDSVWSLNALNASLRMPGSGEVNALTIIGGEFQASAYGIYSSAPGYNWDINGLTIEGCTTKGIYVDGGSLRTARIFAYFEQNGTNHIHLNSTVATQNWRIGGIFAGTLTGADIDIDRGFRCVIEPSTFHVSRTHIDLSANADQTIIHPSVGPSATDIITIVDSGKDTRILYTEGSIYLGGQNGAVTIDWRANNQQDFVINGDITMLNFIAPPIAHTIITLSIAQNVTGGWTVAWPTINWKGGSGLQPDPTASTTSVYQFYYDGSAYHELNVNN